MAKRKIMTQHLTNIKDIERTILDNRLCLFFIKAPDCGVCNVMFARVGQLASGLPSLCSFYRFLVYSGPTVLLLMDGKEVYRSSQFIDMQELEQMINRYLSFQMSVK